MKKAITYFLLFAAVAFFSGCNYERIKGERLNSASGPVPVPTNPEHLPATFSEIQSLILNKSCIGCHGPNGKSGIEIHQYTQVMDYVEPGKPDESIFYIYLETGEMPKGPHKITGKLLEGVKKWIENGAKETET